MRVAAMWITVQVSIIATDTRMDKRKPPTGGFFSTNELFKRIRIDMDIRIGMMALIAAKHRCLLFHKSDLRHERRTNRQSTGKRRADHSAIHRRAPYKCRGYRAIAEAVDRQARPEIPMTRAVPDSGLATGRAGKQSGNRWLSSFHRRALRMSPLPVA